MNSLNTGSIINPRKVGFVGHIALIDEMRNTKFLSENFNG
jgi:hypothetical protein